MRSGAFEVSTVDLDRGGVSWTVDMLVTLAAEHLSAALHLILRPNALANLPTRRKPCRILDLAKPLAVERKSFEDVTSLAKNEGLGFVEQHQISLRMRVGCV